MWLFNLSGLLSSIICLNVGTDYMTQAKLKKKLLFKMYWYKWKVKTHRNLNTIKVDNK